MKINCLCNNNRLRNKKLTACVTPTAYVINEICLCNNKPNSKENTYVMGLQLVNNVSVLCISFLVTFSLFAVQNCGFDYFRDKVKGCGHCKNLIHDFSTAIWLILTD